MSSEELISYSEVAGGAPARPGECAGAPEAAGGLRSRSHAAAEGSSELSWEKRPLHSAPGAPALARSLCWDRPPLRGPDACIPDQSLGNPSVLLQEPCLCRGQSSGLLGPDSSCPLPTSPLKVPCGLLGGFAGRYPAWPQVRVSEASSALSLLQIPTAPCCAPPAGVDPGALQRGWGRTGKRGS